MCNYFFLFDGGAHQYNKLQQGCVLCRFLVLLHEFIPISLYVTVELVNVVQCMYIGWDLQIYSTEDDMPARARASGFVEELGQVRLPASISMQN